MLGQAAAMLIPFPAAIAAKVCHGTLPFAFDQVRSFAGPSVSVLSADRLGVRVIGICICRTRRRSIVGLVG